MKPGSFDYIGCDSSDEAVAQLGEFGEDARILAGGQSLMILLNMRLTQPRMLVDISRTRELDYVRIEKERLVVGAAATQMSVERRATLDEEVPLLKSVFPHISHFQIRNRGTVCGSIAHADPSAELPLVLACLGGEVVLRSHRGRRVVVADEFFTGMLQTARNADELLEEVRFPLRIDGHGYAFDEFAQRHGDFAIVACAAVVSTKDIRLAIGGVADRPRVACWPRALVRDAGGQGLAAALNDFAWSLEAQDDAHASAAYRRHLVRALGRRVIERACA